MRCNYWLNFAICLLTVLASTTERLYSQSELDILPQDNRNEIFHAWLMEELDSLSNQRKNHVTDSLASQALLLARQERLRADYNKLLGEFPVKSPLNPQITDTIFGDGYTIEKVFFESRPDHHVTGNYYCPVSEEGHFPAILITCGHYPEAKSADLYQRLCILLAQNGFAAFIVDPICQGERNQIINPANGALYYSGESGTKAHTRLDVGASLVGTSVVAYEIWDNHRSIDYLFTRPEVDTNRIGLTGSSGGGAQATFLAAFDDRVKVTAVNSFIMNEPTLFSTIGPQTGSQNLSYEGIYGIDHPEYITMFAPKPFKILAATQDFFAIEGTHETYAESLLIYDTLQAIDNLGYFEYDDTHGYSKPKREKAVQWFRTWFYDDTTSVTEPDDLATLDENQLQVTNNGQVFNSFENEKTVQDINLELAENYSINREEFWSSQTKDSCLNKVRQLVHLDEDYIAPDVEIVETLHRQGYSIEKIKLSSGNMTPLAGLMFLPDELPEEAPAVLYIDGRGKRTDAEEGDIIESFYVDSGKVVFAVDVRGFGETTDNPSLNESKHGNNEHRNAVISLYTGKTLIGQRVEDIMKAVDYLFTRPEIDTSLVSVVGINRAGSAVLHAAALDERLSSVDIRDWTDTSWTSIVADPTMLNNMTHMVPSALKFYDLPDLVNAIAPRPVIYSPEPVIPNDQIFDFEEAAKNGFEIIYPNPSNNNVRISYKLTNTGIVILRLFDNNGNEIEVLTNQFQTADRHELNINTSGLVPGTYFLRLEFDGKNLGSEKLVVL